MNADLSHLPSVIVLASSLASITKILICWLFIQDWTTSSYTLSRDSKKQEACWNHWWRRGREEAARRGWTHPLWKTVWWSYKWCKKEKALVPEWLQRWHIYSDYCLHHLHLLCLPYSNHYLRRSTWRSHRKQNCSIGVSCCWTDLWSNIWFLLWSTLNYSGLNWSCLGLWNHFVRFLQVRKHLIQVPSNEVAFTYIYIQLFTKLVLKNINRVIM